MELDHLSQRSAISVLIYTCDEQHCTSQCQLPSIASLFFLAVLESKA